MSERDISKRSEGGGVENTKTLKEFYILLKSMDAFEGVPTTDLIQRIETLEDDISTPFDLYEAKVKDGYPTRQQSISQLPEGLRDVVEDLLDRASSEEQIEQEHRSME